MARCQDSERRCRAKRERGMKKNQTNNSIKQREEEKEARRGSHREFDLMRTVAMVTAYVRLFHGVRHSGGSDVFPDVLQLFDETSS